MAHSAQVPLSQLERGLAFPIARLAEGAAELSHTLQIKFEEAEDELGPLLVALLRSGEAQFALVQHQKQLLKGVDLLINEHAPDPAQALAQALAILGPVVQRPLWVHPSVEQVFMTAPPSLMAAS